MNVLIDIGHPAHIHLFRNVIHKLQASQYKVIITTREKDITIPLLDAYSLDYLFIGKNRASLIGKLFGILFFTRKIVRIIRKSKVVLVLSHSSIYAAIAAWWTRRYSITLEDTGNKEQVYLYWLFTHLILSPQCLMDNLGRKHIHYPSFHESAYTYPKYFIPDNNVLQELGLNENEQYTIVRFVARKSSHDFGENRLSDSDKVRIVERLSSNVKVFISSEEKLPVSLQPFAFPISFTKMHHAMALSSLIYGESATMCSEAAFLGVPSILLDHQGRDYTDYLEKGYSLVKNFTGKNYSIDKSLDFAIEIVNANNIDYFKHKSDLLLKEHLNLTDLLFWLITNYPQSITQLKTDPKVFDPFYSPPRK